MQLEIDISTDATRTLVATKEAHEARESGESSGGPALGCVDAQRIEMDKRFVCRSERKYADSLKFV